MLAVSQYPSDNLAQFSILFPKDITSPIKLCGRAITENYLVIYLDSKNDLAVVINLESKTLAPLSISYDELVFQIDNDTLLVGEPSWHPKTLVDIEDLSSAQKEKMERRYEIIKPLVQDLDAVIRNRVGDKVFANAAEISGVTRQLVYDTFYSYLRHGCRKMGLVMPQGKNSAETERSTNYRVKQGRPPKNLKGMLLLDDDNDNLEKYCENYAKTPSLTIVKAYKLMLRERYFKTRRSSTPQEQRTTGLRMITILKDPHERPTYDQFYYYLNQKFEGNISKRDRGKKNKMEVAANDDGRQGNANIHASGPGEIYYLDETPFPEELVSIFDPERKTKIGKGTVYFLVDNFTDLIAGLYISTESPSFATVKEALFNASRDKQKWVNELGLDINVEGWVSRDLPQIVFVDNDAFKGEVSEGPITAGIPVTIKYGRPGRGDDKKMGEKHFDLAMELFRGLSKAHETKSRLDIARQIARKNACLTINELYEILIHYILFRNNVKRNDKFPLTIEMVRDKVPPIPTKVWEWGKLNRPGYTMHVPENQLYIDLLETGTVTCHKEYINLKDKGLRYTCDWTFRKGYQDKRKGSKLHTFKCRYHRGIAGCILIVTPDGLMPAYLEQDHQIFKKCSFKEVKEHRESNPDGDQQDYESEMSAYVSLMGFLEEKVKTAQKERKPSPTGNIQQIKANRRFESLLDQQRQVVGFLSAIADTTDICPPENTTEEEKKVDDHAARSAFYDAN